MFILFYFELFRIQIKIIFFQPEIPITDNLDPLALLTDDAQIAAWNNEGLPNDRMSSENATILTNSVRWPLMVDPQVRNIFIFERYLISIA